MKETAAIAQEESTKSSRSLHKELKFNAWLAVATVTYLITLYLVRTNPDWAPALKVIVTLLPILPGLLYLRSGVKLLRSMDELQRRIQFEAWLFAAICTVVVGAIINVLTANGIVWEEISARLGDGRHLSDDVPPVVPGHGQRHAPLPIIYTNI